MSMPNIEKVVKNIHRKMPQVSRKISTLERLKKSVFALELWNLLSTSQRHRQAVQLIQQPPFLPTHCAYWASWQNCCL